MAITPIKGLRVSLKMTDVIDKEQALSNINLNLGDLDKIRGISASGVLPEDISTLSGLESDLEKELVGIYSDTSLYRDQLSVLNTGESRITHNMTANAIVAASSFKYNILAANGSVISSDISTSRQSAWSSLANTFYYGGTVEAGKDITLSSLNIDRPIRAKQFEAEFPTHTIRFKVNGEDYRAYAMKNIPLRFSGNFRSPQYYNVRFYYINANPGFAAPYLRPSLVITKKTDGLTTTYSNIGSLGAPYDTQRNFDTPYFGVNQEGERDIDLYYPASGILELDLDGIQIYSLPDIVFNNLRRISLYSSDLKEMPNFRKIAPNLQDLHIGWSYDLNKSDNVNLRNFNDNVVNLLPTSLTKLDVSATYGGLATANLDSFSLLKDFRFRSMTPREKATGVSPAVNKDAIEIYNISGQNFSALHPSVYTSPTLKILNVASNSNMNVPISITSNVIEELTLQGTSMPVINVSNKTTLKYYSASNPPANTVITDYFLNCPSLITLSYAGTRATGPLPSLDTNISLQSFHAHATYALSADPTYTINATSFGVGIEGGCRKTLTTFFLASGLLSGPIHPNAFDGLVRLRTVYICGARGGLTLDISTNILGGITGSIPSFSQSSDLQSIQMDHNELSGQVPSFSANPNIRSLAFRDNNLSGELPGFNLNSLSSIYFSDNQLTSIGFLNCPNLFTIDVSNNLITSIPNLSGCPRLRNILMNFNPLSSISNVYTPGNLSTHTDLNIVSFRNCNIKRNFIDQILIDLAANYDLRPRAAVSVDLRGNESPSSSDAIQINIIARLIAAGWIIRLV